MKKCENLKFNNKKELENKNVVKFFADQNKVESKSFSKKHKKLTENKVETVFMLNKDAGLRVTDEEVKIGVNYGEIETETIKQAGQIVERQNKKSTKWFNVSFFMLNILVVVLVLIYQINNLGVASIQKLITFRWSFLIYALLAFLAIMMLESFRTYILIYKSTKTSRPILSYKLSAIKTFYDCITPVSMGGQPFEIFYLNSRGLKGGVATSVPLAKSVFQIISFIIVSLVVFIFGFDLLANQVIIITWSIVSLSVAILLVAIVLLFSVSKKIMPKITMFLIKVLHKLKLIKDYNLSFNKCMRVILEYQKSMKFYAKSFLVVVLSFVNCGLILALKASIPLMIYCVFNSSVSPNIIMTIFSNFIVIELATKFIPIPGGMGITELSFTALFASIFSDGTLFWAMLIYKIFNYFIYLLQGLIVVTYDFCYGNRKNNKRLTEKMLLEKNILKEE